VLGAVFLVDNSFSNSLILISLPSTLFSVSFSFVCNVDISAVDDDPEALEDSSSFSNESILSCFCLLIRLDFPHLSSKSVTLISKSEQVFLFSSVICLASLTSCWDFLTFSSDVLLVSLCLVFSSANSFLSVSI